MYISNSEILNAHTHTLDGNSNGKVRTIWSCTNVYVCNWFFLLFEIIFMVWLLWLWQSMHVFHLKYTHKSLKLLGFFFHQIFHHHLHSHPNITLIIFFITLFMCCCYRFFLYSLCSHFLLRVLFASLCSYCSSIYRISNVQSPGNMIEFFLLLLLFWVCVCAFAFVCKKYMCVRVPCALVAFSMFPC